MEPNLALAYQPKRTKSLQRLSIRHRTIIALHLSGKTGPQIAEYVGCSVGSVYQILRDPSARKIIEHYLEGIEGDLAALLPKAVEAVRSGLDHPSPKIYLGAVDRFAKMTSRGVAPGGDTNVTVNLMQDTRERFIAELKELHDGVIESTAEEVSVEDDS